MFVKRTEDQYNLVFDYDLDLPLGETIKTYKVYMDNNLISGVYRAFLIPSQCALLFVTEALVK